MLTPEEVSAKYGKKERNRVYDILHKTSKRIVNQNMGIILEDIKKAENKET